MFIRDCLEEVRLISSCSLGNEPALLSETVLVEEQVIRIQWSGRNEA